MLIQVLLYICELIKRLFQLSQSDCKNKLNRFTLLHISECLKIGCIKLNVLRYIIILFSCRHYSLLSIDLVSQMYYCFVRVTFLFNTVNKNKYLYNHFICSAYWCRMKLLEYTAINLLTLTSNTIYIFLIKKKKHKIYCFYFV